MAADDPRGPQAITSLISIHSLLDLAVFGA